MTDLTTALLAWAILFNAWLGLLVVTVAIFATWLCIKFWVKAYGRLHDKIHRPKAAKKGR